MEVERKGKWSVSLDEVIVSSEEEGGVRSAQQDSGGDFLEEAKPSKKNGETLAQMRHARKIKKTQGDTSRDVLWEQDPSLAATDMYVKVTTFLYLVPRVLVFALPLLLFAFPIALWAWLYGIFMKKPKERIHRNCGFWTLYIMLLPFALPYLCLVTIAFGVDCLFYYIFSVPYYCYRVCSGKKTSLKVSWDCIKPYRNGPSIFLHLEDVFVALIGQTVRQGLIECTGKLSFMVMLLPWLKYYINTNPWLYNLEERFVQQISTSMMDMETSDVANVAREIISQSKQSDRLQHSKDLWSFAPHYPYPPDGRNYAIGIQAASNTVAGFFLMVHTTHALKMNTIEKRDPNYFVFSSSVELPVYRVMLWYNNPYHFFTGYVEASISTGGKYQTDKICGGEHPMWILTGRSPMLSCRKSKVGVGAIDHFFDTFLPMFVFEVRKQVLGEEHAKKKYEEVISADGISRPAGIP